MRSHCALLLVIYLLQASHALQLQVVTVATQETDGYKRFLNSANFYNIAVEVVGMGMEWRGGDIQRYPGGGFKINLLKPIVEKWKGESDLIVMFVDSYDVIFSAGPDVILQKFQDFNANVVFSAEQFCWPDQSLAVGLGKRFLCSGGFIGYARDVYDIVSDTSINDTDDDQLYYTNVYLNENKRKKHNIRLDHRSHIFQNLNGAEDEIDLHVTSNDSYAMNTLYTTRPAVFHGNGPSKNFLNLLGNYIPDQFNEEKGCIHCFDNIIRLPNETSKWPTVLVGIFIELPTPFLSKVLEKFYRLDYPKNLMKLWIHNKESFHENEIRDWSERMKSDYSSVHYVSSEENMSESEARTRAMQEAVNSKTDYYFMMDSSAVFDDPTSLKKLITLNRPVLTPVLNKLNKLWSNFWGAVAADGFYSRSRDYFSIIEKRRTGIWNVPFISVAILFKGSWLSGLANGLPQYESQEYEPDMTFCKWMRDNGHFMFVSNLHEYGHLISTDNYETHHMHNDLYNIFENRLEWEEKYLHENYSKVMAANPEEVLQPCTDVYWFPLLSTAYAKEIIDELENFGKWSNGKNDDPRIAGGYENVPTRDIHMNQVGFEKQWLNILSTYVVPIQIKVFPGYYSRANADLNFVVKYHPEGQPDLRPHHDSSTFTINVALTQPGIDHEGGGCRFIRQNCSVIDTKLGWALIHPGRLTHYHEGLPTTKGTRYIMVSFVDP